MGVSRKTLFCRVDWRSWDAGTLRYLTYLASKHDIYPYKFLRAFVEAERKGTAVCGPLKITLRRRARDYAIFLLTRESKIVGQIRMSGTWKGPTRIGSLYSRRIDRVGLFGRRDT